MKIFRSVIDFPTDKLLHVIEMYIRALFGLGFFIGLALAFTIFSLKGIGTSQNDTALLATSFILLLVILLVMDFHFRTNILPELRKRIERK